MREQLMVKIPNSLIKHIQSLGPHFIRVAQNDKMPIDKDWPSNPLSHDDPKLVDWLDQDGNYGIMEDMV